MKKQKNRGINALKAHYGRICVFPWVIGLVLFFALPVIQSVIYSFSKVSLTTEGLKTTLDILPALVCLMTCIGMFKASGCMEILTQFISPVTSFFGFPDECTPLIFIRPLSGSGALSVYDGIISQYGADSFAGRACRVSCCYWCEFCCYNGCSGLCHCSRKSGKGNQNAG